DPERIIRVILKLSSCCHCWKLELAGPCYEFWDVVGHTITMTTMSSGNMATTLIPERKPRKCSQQNEKHSTALQLWTHLGSCSHMDPDPGPDLTVVLLGNCGVGKSASGNTILGRAAFESKTSFKAGESEIREEAGRVFGKVIRVIDTPGILGREEPVGRCCRHVLESPGSHLFLLVVKTDRFTAEQERGVEAGLAAVGGRGFSRCYLLFTGGDALKNTSLHDFIYQDRQSPLPDLVSRCRGRHCVLDNTRSGERAQVERFLRLVDDIIRENDGRHWSRDALRSASAKTLSLPLMCWMSKVCKKRAHRMGL
uniref:AIG1-type G domain-containing protein n=1 Tax=Haplochromis burtoni TaxID=8153 RepID=A0A3Q2WDC8_HAPBU